MASVKDVARLAGVSFMTVSRALNTPEKLNQETLAKVRQAVEALGYVPSLSARKIRGGHSSGKTIGVFALDTATTPFAVEMLLSMERTARENGWNVFILNVFEAPPSQQAIDLMLSHQPDGIIFSAMQLRTVEIPPVLRSLPLVLSNCMSSEPGVACYVPDDADGQYQAVRQVLKRGYRHPLCINLPQASLAWEPRQMGLRRALTEAGMSADDVPQYNLSTDDAYQETIGVLENQLRGLKGRPAFDLLICGNDRIALVAYQFLLGRGLRIPAEVAVLGYDNMIGVAELFYPPLSTVQLPYYEMGRRAAQYVIEGRNETTIHRVECPLVERESC
ncbi:MULTISPECIES: LacI family DNA-binding transcriptional regulator [unclassified Pseudomonas]|uniref:LacI family DNA-binding transcriptional regulator n=1 Tax=unclassified Pseudomonas TaxID=196821 RepID=UPI00191303B0|nr:MULTISPECIES: LacI family DNA-binding transcriptional regulator [unclassified Pseudomonas]MBK5552884.1 LacI family DNA-binding transcriptional regulator [Pseudomonas sp. TH03]MEB0224598.1 LacI family DNA-binding transcriptional regulator [Pseudomonas sp. 5S1]MEB0298372.1 LacI family DNA-binding transcriptional regulator [Pseudomonas sp. 10S4]WPX16976.1 LacI family DNA-binding transcriptional regulator [Pseudomonas sp. 10S4]